MKRVDRGLSIVYVLRKFPKLSETFILNEILGLEAHGAKVHIFSLAPSRDPRFHEGLSRLKASVWYVPGPTELAPLRKLVAAAGRRFGAAYARELARALASGRPRLLWRFYQSACIAERAARLRVDHLHAHFATRATTVAGIASRLSGIPYSFTAHAFDIYKTRTRGDLLARKIDHARFVVTISQANLEFLRSVANGSNEKIKLIHNGIDLSRFTATDAPPAGPFTILSVARLVEKKGLPVLIEACRILRQRGIDFRCRIIGRGRMRSRLQELIAHWELKRHVRLLGGCTQGEVLAAYRAAHVYALPSIVGSDGNKEGLPVSIVEALACSLPVVSTPVAGIPEAVRDGHNGLLVPEGDASALAEALARLHDDAGLYSRLRAVARSSVHPVFDQKRTSRALRSLLGSEDGS